MVAHGGVQWTQQRVHDLAPDRASVAAARRLAAPGPWSRTGATGDLLWGRCQGSGATPYEVTIELDGPVLRCSCPSRKQPCKHGLALLLRWVLADGHLPHDADAPAATTGRGRPRSPTADVATSTAAPDPEAQARRAERRAQLMTDGLAELERWLTDLVRDGLAAARHQPYAFWDTAAARLVDAQVPGLARRIRDMPGQLVGREDWADHLLAEVGRWYLAVRTWPARAALDQADQADLRTYLGWARPAEEVLAGDRLHDRWLVLGVRRSEDGPLVEQRTWLQGLGGGEVGMVLDFAGGGAVLQTAQVVGSVVEAAVARYPGHIPARLRFVGDPVAAGRAAPRDATDLGGAVRQTADQLAANPWASRTCVVLDRASLVVADAQTAVVGVDGARLPVVDVDRLGALAVTGGHPVTLVCELERGHLRPLSALLAGTLVPL